MNIFRVVGGTLATGAELAEVIEKFQAGEDLDQDDYKPMAHDLLNLVKALKVKQDWVTDEMLAEGLEMLGNFLESKRPA
jgi:hypothetical protein